MKRDQFGRDIRKRLDGHVSSDQVRELYQIFIEGDFTIDNFLNVFADAQNLKLKTSIPKIHKFKKPTPEQIEKHNRWQKESVAKAAFNLSKKPKKTLKHTTVKMQKIKQEEGAAMQMFWDQFADHRGWCRCTESGKWIGTYRAMYVHHIWTKGSNPASRCDMENFIILSQEAHDQAHNGEKEMKCYPFMKERRQYLKKKYAMIAAGDIVQVATDLIKALGSKVNQSGALIKKIGENLNKDDGIPSSQG